MFELIYSHNAPPNSTPPYLIWRGVSGLHYCSKSAYLLLQTTKTEVSTVNFQQSFSYFLTCISVQECRIRTPSHIPFPVIFVCSSSTLTSPMQVCINIPVQGRSNCIPCNPRAAVPTRSHFPK